MVVNCLWLVIRWLLTDISQTSLFSRDGHCTLLVSLTYIHVNAGDWKHKLMQIILCSKAQVL